jgi:hypothetical protein
MNTKIDLVNVAAKARLRMVVAGGSADDDEDDGRYYSDREVRKAIDRKKPNAPLKTPKDIKKHVLGLIGTVDGHEDYRYKNYNHNPKTKTINYVGYDLGKGAAAKVAKHFHRGLRDAGLKDYKVRVGTRGDVFDDGDAGKWHHIIHTKDAVPTDIRAKNGWFKNLSEKEQKEYIENHPRCKYAKDRKAKNLKSLTSKDKLDIQNQIKHHTKKAKYHNSQFEKLYREAAKDPKIQAESERAKKKAKRDGYKDTTKYYDMIDKHPLGKQANKHKNASFKSWKEVERLRKKLKGA